MLLILFGRGRKELLHNLALQRVREDRPAARERKRERGRKRERERERKSNLGLKRD